MGSEVYYTVLVQLHHNVAGGGVYLAPVQKNFHDNADLIGFTGVKFSEVQYALN